jgi:DNA-binding MarR family transcriptional regulator
MDEARKSEAVPLAVAASYAAEDLDRYFVGLALKRAQHELRLAINAELTALDTNISQLNVLFFIRRNPGVSSADLARLAFLTPQTLGQQVIHLERRGLVKRKPGDGRKIRHSLTKAGDRLLDAGMARVREVDTRVLSDFDDDVVATLLDAFQTIERRATESRAESKRFAPFFVERPDKAERDGRGARPSRSRP